MHRDPVPLAPGISDEAYQEQILLHVSRTFALTIPQLPPALCSAVTSAYLLCRIADTIEDEPALSSQQTLAFLQRFRAVVHGTEDAASLVRDLEGCFSDGTLPEEHDLVRNMGRPVRMLGRLDARQKAAIQRCIDVMCHGMHHFQRTASLRGLPRSSDLDDYCYCVAGCVGEMLTELFCAHSPGAARHQAALQGLAVSFAQGLQMTNILKDVWEDHRRGACWLPQEVFTRHGVDLALLTPENQDARFVAGMRELIGVAHAHLRNALAFTLLIPAQETGIRRFCLWAVGLAILTLRKLERNPGFTSGAQVKVRRSAVGLTCTLTNLAVGQDWILRRLFDLAATGLPLAPPGQVRRTRAVLGIAERPEEAPVPSVRRPAVPEREALAASAAATPTPVRPL